MKQGSLWMVHSCLTGQHKLQTESSITASHGPMAFLVFLAAAARTGGIPANFLRFLIPLEIPIPEVLNEL